MSRIGLLHSTALLCLSLGTTWADTDDPEPPASAKVEMKRLEGTYEVMSFSRDGMAYGKAELDTMKVVLKAAECSFSQGATVYTSTMTITPNKKVKEVDSVYTNSFVKGSRVKGLYKIEKDRVTFCYGPPNGERPTDFSAVAGSNQTLYVLQRVKQK